MSKSRKDQRRHRRKVRGTPAGEIEHQKREKRRGLKVHGKRARRT